MDIIVVVLGANMKSIRTKDSSALINYIFNNYSYVDVSSTINNSFNEYLPLFAKNCLLEKTTTSPILKLGKIDNSYFPLSNNNGLELSTKVYTLNSFSPSIKKDSKVGSLELYNGDNILCSVDILLDNELIKNNFWYYFNLIISNPFAN